MNARADLAALPNLGLKSAAMLEAANIQSVTQLWQLGAVAAFIKLRRCGLNPSLNLLWALQGALSAQAWQVVAREQRLSLLSQLEDFEREQRSSDC